jgi:hypothetical protein
LHATLSLHDIGYVDNDPNSVTITITKEQSMFLLKMIEPAAVLRVTFTALLTEMRRKDWI